MTTKTLSLCCSARVKVNVRDGGYLCGKCGEDCTTKTERTGFGSKPSTLSKVRKVTGERELFVGLWAKAGGRSRISGEKLLPPEHPMFHFQFAHLAPKGAYPELRLMEENVWPVTVDEHQYQTNDPGTCQRDPKWKDFWTTRAAIVGACRSAPVRWVCVEGRIVASVCCTPPFHSLNR